LSRDKLGPAAALENAIIAAAKGEEPEHFNSLATAIAKGIQDDIDFTIPDQTADKPSAQPVTHFWTANGGTNGTPKTDMIIGGQKISLKMGAGQFMSGERGEAKATFIAALEIAEYETSDVTAAVIKKINEMKSGVEYSIDITKIRNSAGYVAGGTSAEAKQLLKQEKIQKEIQSELDNILDPEASPSLKAAFVLESMSGLFKFGEDSLGKADWLLKTLGKGTIYGMGKKKGISSLNPKEQTAMLRSAFEIKRIDAKLAKDYSDNVSIVVKFKSRKDSKGQRTMSDVIGVMLAEETNFKAAVANKLKKENKLISHKHRLLSEFVGKYDDNKLVNLDPRFLPDDGDEHTSDASTMENIPSWAQDLWLTTMEKINELYDYIVAELEIAEVQGWQQLIKFLGFDIDITVS
jgi:hypothetical protein